MALAQYSSIFNQDGWLEVTAASPAAVALDSLSLAADVNVYEHSSDAPYLGLVLEAQMTASPSAVGTVSILGRRMELRGQAANHASPPSSSFLHDYLGKFDISDAVGTALFYAETSFYLPQSEVGSKWEFYILPKGLTGGTGIAAGWKLWRNPLAYYPKPS